MKNKRQTNLENALIALGHRVRRLREKNGLTQAQFAEHTGNTLKRIRRIESGQATLTYSDLAAIAEALHITLYKLLSGIA